MDPAIPGLPGRLDASEGRSGESVDHRGFPQTVIPNVWEMQHYQLWTKRQPKFNVITGVKSHC